MFGEQTDIAGPTPKAEDRMAAILGSAVTQEWWLYTVFWAFVGGMFGSIMFPARKQPVFLGFLIGMFLGPVFIWFCLMLEQKGVRKCPSCAEKVNVSAKVCRFCQRDLPAPMTNG
jgi:energy-coupling factor transporter transmembrane protein EcfT